MNPKLLRGSLETIIIKMLSDHGEMYGYEMTKKVRELTDENVKITEGALYPALHKMEAKGILLVETRSIGNRFRKYYKLTEEGQKEVDVQVNEMHDYIDQMLTLLKPKIA